MSVAPVGTSVITDAMTGAPLLAGLGALTATESGAIVDAINATGLASATRSTLKG